MRWMSGFLFVLVSLCSTAQAAISRIAVSGDSAPGIAGAKFESFTHVSLNSSGLVAFIGNLQNGMGGVSATNDQVLYTFTGGTLALRAREGNGGVPAAPGANFSNFQDVAIADTGDVLLRGTLPDDSFSTEGGLWRLSAGGDTVIARTGVGDAPGFGSGEQFSSMNSVIRTTENGDVAFDGQASGGNVTSLDDRGIWFYQGTTGNLFVRKLHSPVPGVSNATFEAFGVPSINNFTQVTAKGTLKVSGSVTLNNRNGVWRYTGINGELLARQGVGMAPGTAGSFGLFGNPVINSTGQVAFRADHATSGAGIWKYTDTTGELVALANTVSVPDVPSASFASFDDPLLADTGAIIASATMNTGLGSVTTQNDAGIWYFSSGGDRLLLRDGSGGVPGVSNANFASFDAFAANDSGSAVVAATLQYGPGGVGPTNDAGLWYLPDQVHLNSSLARVICLRDVRSSIESAVGRFCQSTSARFQQSKPTSLPGRLR